MLTIAMAAFIPRMLGNASAPSENPLSPKDTSRMKNSVTSMRTGQKKWVNRSPP